MKNLDIQYLCKIIGDLSGVPIRLYEGDTLVFYHALVELPKDPMALYRTDIWKITDHVGYYATNTFSYYGIINFGTGKIILGPTQQLGNTDQELRELAFRLDVAQEDTEAFLIGMKSIIRMPLASIMQILCTMNHILNGEKLDKNYLTHGDILAGGKMSIKMNDKPNTKRGTEAEARPYSFSKEK